MHHHYHRNIYEHGFLRAAHGEKYACARVGINLPAAAFRSTDNLLAKKAIALIACLESGDTRATGKKLIVRGKSFDSHSAVRFFVDCDANLYLLYTSSSPNGILMGNSLMNSN